MKKHRRLYKKLIKVLQEWREWGGWKQRWGTKIENNSTKETYYSNAFKGWFFHKPFLFWPNGLSQLTQVNVIYKTLCVFLGVGHLEGSGGWYSKDISSPCPAVFWPSLSWPSFWLGASLAPFGSGRCDTGYFWMFLSCSHAFFSSTGQIIPLIPLRTDQRQQLQEKTGLNFWIKSNRKRDQGHRALSYWWTQSPKGAQTAQMSPGKIRISFHLLLDVEKELKSAFGLASGFILLPSSTLFFWGVGGGGRKVNM